MALGRAHEVLKVGRRLAAAGKAGLKPATTIRRGGSVYFQRNGVEAFGIAMALGRAYEVLKVGRRLTAAGKAGLKSMFQKSFA